MPSFLMSPPQNEKMRERRSMASIRVREMRHDAA
jgi:hypothetical protein